MITKLKIFKKLKQLKKSNGFNSRIETIGSVVFFYKDVFNTSTFYHHPR